MGERLGIDLHVHFHNELPDGASGKLDEILAHIGAIRAQEKHLMSDVTSIKQLVTDLDAETNAVAAKVDAQASAIADLKAQLAAGTPVTQADLDAIQAGLQPISDRLKALGSDADAPIPPEA